MVKTWLAYSRHCASVWTLVLLHFFPYLNPLANEGVTDPVLNFPRSTPVWGLTWEGWPFLGRYRFAEKSRFPGDLQQLQKTLGLLLAYHLVTIGVCINPWEAVNPCARGFCKAQN